MRAAVAAVIAVPLLAAGMLIAPAAFAVPQPPTFEFPSYELVIAPQLPVVPPITIPFSVNVDGDMTNNFDLEIDGANMCGLAAPGGTTVNCSRGNVASFFVPVVPGHHTLTARLTDPFDSTFSEATAPLRLVYPAPVIAGGPLNLTADFVDVSGTGYSPNGEIAILPVGDLDATPLCTATVDLSSNFTCSIERDLMTSPTGNYAAYQYLADSFDSTLLSAPSAVLNLSTEPHTIKAPTPVITSPAMWGQHLGAGGMTVSGTGGLASDGLHDVLVRVEYSPHGDDTWSTFCDEPSVSGDAWSCTGPAIAAGKYDFRPYQLNPGEDPNHGGIVSATIGVSAPEWPGAWMPAGLNNSSSENTALQGIADVGANVVVTINGVEVCNTIAYAAVAPPEPPFGYFYCTPFQLGALGILPGHYTAQAIATIGADVSPPGDMPFAVHYPAPVVLSWGNNGDSTGFEVSGLAYDQNATVAVYAANDIGGYKWCEALPDAVTSYTCYIDRPDLSAAPVQDYVAVQYFTVLGDDGPLSDVSVPFEFSAYDIEAPAPHITSPGDYENFYFDDQPIWIAGDSGLVSSGDDVVSLNVYTRVDSVVNPNPICTIDPVTSSDWGCYADELPVGNYDLLAYQSINGNESTSPSIVSIGILDANDPTWSEDHYETEINVRPGFSGYAIPGRAIEVRVDGTPYCDGYADGETGYWSCEGEPTPEEAGLPAGFQTAQVRSYVPEGAGTNSNWVSVPFSVTYPAPYMNVLINNGNGFTIEGSGWPDDHASVSIFPAGGPSGTPLCTTTVDYTGFFSCTMVNPDLSPTPFGWYEAFQFPTATPPPAGSDYSLPSEAHPISAYDISAPRPNITAPTAAQKIALANQPITVHGTSGLPSSELAVSIVVTYSGPSSGTFCTIANVTAYNWSCMHPATLAPGTYTLTAIQKTATKADSLSATRTFTVLPKPVPRAAAPTPTPTPTPTDTATPEPTESPLPTLPEETPPAAGGTGSGSGSGGPVAPTDRALPGAPSLLTGALITPVELVASPETLAAGTITAFALVVVIIIASEFFGEALSIQYALFTAFLLRRPRIATVTDRVTKWVTGHRVFTGLGLVLLTSLVFSFADPGFGLDLTSIRLMLSCAISIIMINFVSNLLTEGVSSRLWGIPSKLVLMPWGLLVAVLGVLASRALDFSPGFLVGAILGLAVLGDPGPKLESRVIMLNFGITWSIAVGAWLLVGAVPVLNSADPASFWTTLASDSLVATASAGLTALFVMLLPFKLLDGGTLLAYSRWRWVLAFGLTVLAFVMVVLPNAVGWSTDSSKFGPWLITAGVFVAVSVAAYVVARVRKFSAKEA